MKSEALSFGERLKEVREDAGLSLEQLADKTKIQKKYLALLETEEWHALPPAVYMRGFVRQWARVCGTDSGEMISHFERLQALLKRDLVQDKKLERFARPAFVITMKHILFVLGAIIFLGVGGYLGSHYLYLMRAPSLDVQSPKTLESVVRDASVTLEGKAQNVKSLTVAGEVVYVGENGEFRKDVPLNEGVNVLRIAGVGKNGQSFEIIRKVTRIP